MNDRTPADVIDRTSVSEIVNVTDVISVAVTVPTSVCSSSTTKVADDVNTGAVVSSTNTVLTSDDSLPDESDAVYVTVYVATVSTSTASTPVVTISISSPDASSAVAPASLYVEPSSTDCGFSPNNVITGPVVSTTTTVLVAEAELPDESDAV